MALRLQQPCDPAASPGEPSLCVYTGKLMVCMIKTHPSIRNGPTNIMFSLQSMVDHSPDLLLGESPSSCSLSDRVRWGMKALTNWITTSHPHFVLCIAPTTQQVTLFPSEENTCNLISTTQSLVGLYKGLFFSFPFFSLSSASPLPLLLPLPLSPPSSPSPSSPPPPPPPLPPLLPLPLSSPFPPPLRVESLMED